MNNNKTCIIVLGMHRSGTSALTGLLEKCGVKLGINLMSANKYNAKGYFENLALVKFNDELLAANGYIWCDFVSVVNYSEQDRQLLKQILIKEFDNEQLIAIKDPRIIFLFDIYRDVLQDLGYDIKIILPYRNPLEVALSLKTRDKLDFDRGVLFWAYNVIFSEYHSRGLPRMSISFDDIVQDSSRELIRITKFLGINLQLIDNINDFIDSEMKNNLNADFAAYNKYFISDIFGPVSDLSANILSFDMIKAKLFAIILQKYQTCEYEIKDLQQTEYMQLFYYQQDEINVSNVQTLFLSDENQTKFTFELNGISDLTHIRIDVCNFPVVANIESVKLIVEEKEYILTTCYHNANYVDGSSYTYFHDDPINVYHIKPLDIDSQHLMIEIVVDLHAIKHDEVMSLANQITQQQNIRLDELQQSIDGLNNGLVNATNNLNNLQNVLANIKTELTNVYNSRSWNFTKPLRRVMNLFK